MISKASRISIWNFNLILKIILMSLILTLSGCFFTSKTSHLDSENNEVLAQLNMKLGLYYFTENKDVARAKEKLLKATQQLPKNPMTWYTLAYFEEQIGDIKSATQHYKYALKISPQDPATQNNYAAFLCKQGEYSEALNYFLRAAENPNYLNMGKAYQNASQCAMKIPDVALAKKYDQLAHERDPLLGSVGRVD